MVVNQWSADHWWYMRAKKVGDRCFKVRTYISLIKSNYKRLGIQRREAAAPVWKSLATKGKRVEIRQNWCGGSSQMPRERAGMRGKS